jgi:flagellar protein FlaJ
VNSFKELKDKISKETEIIKELDSLLNNLTNTKDIEEKNMISSQINSLKNLLKKTNKNIPETLKKITLIRQLPQKRKVFTPPVKLEDKDEKVLIKKPGKSNLPLSKLEKRTLKRIKKKKEEIIGEKIIKPSSYIKFSNKIFSNLAIKIIKKGKFKDLETNLLKANLKFLPKSYVSVIFFTTLLSIIVSLFLLTFFLFFNIGPNLPILTKVTEDIFTRLSKIFWILFAIPIGTFLIIYFYPSMEKKSAAWKINQELPFATINMAAISGSMIEPSKIFSIIVSTKEYPYLKKEFTKLINDINILGYDLVSALRNSANNSSSKKLTELLNGIATTINSGGNLPVFFDKRAQSLLFEYRVEKEKKTRSAETFMDIYISVVIAAPMILMLLLMMMKISGLGISLSTSMITLIMVLGVSIMNIVFLTFLHLKHSGE